MENSNFENEQKQQEVKKSKTADKIVSIIIAIFLLFCFTALVVNNATSDKTDDKEIKETTPQEYYHSLKESALYDGLDVEVYSWSFENSFCGIEPSSQTGETLVVINMRLTNTTNKTKKLKEGTFFPSMIYTYTLIYDSDYEYNGCFKTYSNFIDAYSEITALQTIDASLCFKVPTTLQTNKKELLLQFKKNKIADVDAIHYWTLREKPVEE